MRLSNRPLGLLIPVLLVPLLALTASSAFAQIPVEGQVYLSFDAGVRVRTLDVVPGVPFQIFVIVDAPPRGILGIEGSVDLGPDVQALAVEWIGNPIDLGPFFPLENGVNFIVGLGQCFETGNGPFAVGSITAVLTAPVSDLEITVGAPPVGPSSPSSFNGEGPGWADCVPELVLFGEDPTGNGIVINPTVIATERSTWGRVKSLF